MWLRVSRLEHQPQREGILEILRVVPDAIRTPSMSRLLPVNAMLRAHAGRPPIAAALGALRALVNAVPQAAAETQGILVRDGLAFALQPVHFAILFDVSADFFYLLLEAFGTVDRDPLERNTADGLRVMFPVRCLNGLQGARLRQAVTHPRQHVRDAGFIPFCARVMLVLQ